MTQTEAPERIWAKYKNGQHGKGLIVDHAEFNGSVEYVPFDLVATKDATIARLVEALEDLLLFPIYPSSAAHDSWRCPDVATWLRAAGRTPRPPKGGCLLLLTPFRGACFCHGLGVVGAEESGAGQQR